MNAKTILLNAIDKWQSAIALNPPSLITTLNPFQKSTSNADRIEILGAIEQLEDQNPYPKPLENPSLLEGNWRLLYTDSKNLLGLNNIPLVEIKHIYQFISINPQQVYNIAELKGLPFLDGVVIAIANWEKVNDKKININFGRTIIGLKSLLNYQSPQQFIKKINNNNKFYPLDITINKNINTISNQNGWLETSYLDQDLRISRGNQGSVFILSKQ